MPEATLDAVLFLFSSIPIQSNGPLLLTLQETGGTPKIQVTYTITKAEIK